MILYTYVYLIDGEKLDFLPEDHSGDEEVPATVRVEHIKFAYPDGDEHTVIGIGNNTMRIKTNYNYVQEQMAKEVQ